MSNSLRKRRAAGYRTGAVTLTLAAFAAAGSGRAADLPPYRDVPPPGAASPAPPASDWRFQATFYGWLTAIDGEIGVRNRPMTPVDASVSEVLENLDGAVMGSFLAENGQWLFLADLVLARLSHTDQIGPYGGGRLDAELSQTIATGAIGHWLPLGVPGLDLGVTAGLRYMRLSADLALSPVGSPLAWSGSQTKQWIDPTVGLVLQWAIDERWFLNSTVDIGGFGVGSKLSSNGYAGIGYKWTPSLSTAIGYRYLYEDYEGAGLGTGSFRYNAVMHGPTFSLGWHF